MTDPNETPAAVLPGWESIKQRTTTFIVVGLLAMSTLLTQGGRDRLGAWTALAMEALSPRQMNTMFSVLPTNLTVEQRRVARWIASRHRVSMGAIEQLVAAAFETSGTFRLDPFLLLAVISIESGFNPLAESQQGAVGLMQIMPRAHADKLKAFGGEKQALDPRVNMQVGAMILREYIDRFGSDVAALKAYVGSLGQPTEYPQRVLQVRERLQAAAVGRVLA
ncbi:MAG: lytic transglycosylase domain-containing protein [Burkholderiaceae bacterium]